MSKQTWAEIHCSDDEFYSSLPKRLPYVIELFGHVPSKKNTWRPRAGGIYQRKEVNKELDALILQARSLWKLDPLLHPEMEVTFYVSGGRSDRDNRLSAILDVLVKAGVLANDSIASFNGKMTVLPAVHSEEEKTIIRLWPKRR